MPPPLSRAPGVETLPSLPEIPVPPRPPIPPMGPGPGRWVRWTVAPGLELHLADDADEAARTLAEELKKYVARRKNA